MIGTQIESYLIQEKLGEGGMGTVYRALETNLERIVAIKVLNTDVARDPAIVERFRSEARAQAHLNHTNIATLFSLLIHQGNPVMVMEYVDGENFQEIVRKNGPLPEPEAIPLFRQALLGVGAAHRMGLVHRDIKPSNLMLNRAGLVKVMDFGIAKVASSDRGLTRTGMQVGTVYYMSPEQVQGQEADARSDIYALGITLYQMVTGHVPFSADSDFKILTDHVQTPPPLPSSFNPAVSKGLEQIILKALAKLPEERFQTVEAFGAALERPETWVPAAPPPVAAVPPVMNTVLEVPTGSALKLNLDPSTNVPPLPPREASAPVLHPIAVPRPPLPPDPSQTLGPARPLPWKAFAAIAALCLVLGGAYLKVRNKFASADTKTVAVAQSHPRPVSVLDSSNSRDEAAPLFPERSNNLRSDSLPGQPRTKKGTNGGVSETSLTDGATGGQTAEATPTGTPPTAQPNRKQPRQVAANNEAEGRAQVQQTAPPPGPSAASQAELDDARNRFIRLRSRALALKAQLADLRQRLAGQGLSVRTDAIEAEGNMDSYMGEADRALQTGNLQSAQTNMDRADHALKLIASVVGG